MPKPFHTLKWFTNRIGTRIYLIDSVNGFCANQKAARKGFVVRDLSHADYLFNVQSVLRYGDQPRKP